jgi:hypothetical protein
MSLLPQHVVNLMDPKDRARLGPAGLTSGELHTKLERRAEKELHRDLVRYLNWLGIPFCHARMDRKSSIAIGYPDFTFPYLGKFVAWEAKTATGKLSPEQEKTRLAIEGQHGEYRVIRHLGGAAEHLREISRSTGNWRSE